MTEAERALVDAVMGLNWDSEDGAEEILAPYILAVRQERLPDELYSQVEALEVSIKQASKRYSELMDDLRLNYPPEQVEAARSKARRQAR